LDRSSYGGEFPRAVAFKGQHDPLSVLNIPIGLYVWGHVVALEYILSLDVYPQNQIVVSPRQ